ncbi:DUF6160 family protein [Alkalimarinus coralli]|uniref:DUF6160 family protein n=1 Tax=Alkalimarinus coralli TaxID=2935863 RepID=UPI00202AFA35|nr:DUF6160 family protein [Alkalimarinus coralli]
MKRRTACAGVTVALLVAHPAFAQMKSLDDATMGSVTGQSGISIELEAKVNIGEIAYKDGGFLLVKDLFLGGVGGTALDNILATVDVASDGEILHHGFSRVAEWADQGLVSSSNADVADAIAKYDQGSGQFGKAFNDGDLVIHVDATNPGMLASNTSSQNIDAYTNSTDFELIVGSVEYAKSTYAPGSNAPSGSSMFSDISMQGHIGPADIVIRNGTNTFSDNASGNLSVSDSKMEIDAYFRVDDLDMDWDNGNLIVLFNFAGLKLRDLKIHNTRGMDSVGSFGFASASATLAAGTNNVTGVSGLAITDVDLRMDLDMPHVQFGSRPSIGEVYFTDFVIQADMLVYGH